jgi:hypothetical protein
MVTPSEYVTSQGWGLIDLPLRVQRMLVHLVYLVCLVDWT